MVTRMTARTNFSLTGGPPDGWKARLSSTRFAVLEHVEATGSTGAGATPSSTTHHPERGVNLKAYKVLLVTTGPGARPVTTVPRAPKGRQEMMAARVHRAYSSAKESA